MSLKNRCRISAALIVVAVMSAGASVQAGESSDKGKSLIEKARDAVLGREVHKLTLFSTVQNYQVSRRGAMRSLLITVDISGDDGMVYFCHNRPRFKEAVLRAVTGFYRASRGTKEIDEGDVRRRTHALFARYLEKDWLVKVDARFVAHANNAGPAVLETRTKCKAATS